MFAKRITMLPYTESTSTRWAALTSQCFKLNGQLSDKVLGSLHNLNSGDISAPLVFLLSQCSVGQVCAIYFKLRLSAQWPERHRHPKWFLNREASFSWRWFLFLLLIIKAFVFHYCYFSQGQYIVLSICITFWLVVQSSFLGHPRLPQPDQRQ